MVCVPGGIHWMSDGTRSIGDGHKHRLFGKADREICDFGFTIYAASSVFTVFMSVQNWFRCF